VKISDGWPGLSVGLAQPHCGCRVLAVLARAGTMLLTHRFVSTQNPVAHVFVVPALRKDREEAGRPRCGYVDEWRFNRPGHRPGRVTFRLTLTPYKTRLVTEVVNTFPSFQVL